MSFCQQNLTWYINYIFEQASFPGVVSNTKLIDFYFILLCLGFFFLTDLLLVYYDLFVFVGLFCVFLFRGGMELGGWEGSGRKRGGKLYQDRLHEDNIFHGTYIMIPALRRQRQISVFKTSLVYTVSARPDRLKKRSK